MTGSCEEDDEIPPFELGAKPDPLESLQKLLKGFCSPAKKNEGAIPAKTNRNEVPPSRTETKTSAQNHLNDVCGETQITANSSVASCDEKVSSEEATAVSDEPTTREPGEVECVKRQVPEEEEEEERDETVMTKVPKTIIVNPFSMLLFFGFALVALLAIWATVQPVHGEFRWEFSRRGLEQIGNAVGETAQRVESDLRSILRPQGREEFNQIRNAMKAELVSSTWKLLDLNRIVMDALTEARQPKDLMMRSLEQARVIQEDLETDDKSEIDKHANEPPGMATPLQEIEIGSEAGDVTSERPESDTVLMRSQNEDHVPTNDGEKQTDEIEEIEFGSEAEAEGVAWGEVVDIETDQDTHNETDSEPVSDTPDESPVEGTDNGMDQQTKANSLPGDAWDEIQVIEFGSDAEAESVVWEEEVVIETDQDTQTETENEPVSDTPDESPWKGTDNDGMDQQTEANSLPGDAWDQLPPSEEKERFSSYDGQDEL